MADIINMKNVSFFAQNQPIVQGFSCQFDKGKITAIIGPSGCGKSTVLKLSAGILVPDEGKIYYKEREIHSMNHQENLDFRREAAMVFQDSAMWENQSLKQNLELPLKMHYPSMTQDDIDKRIQEVLSQIGYRRNLSIRPAQLSMGEQKLIAFARSLMCRPELLFLDEWTESLDESAARRLINLVLQHREEEKTVILVCHNFRIVRNLADYVIMVKGGKFSLKVSREQMENDDQLVKHLEEGIVS